VKQLVMVMLVVSVGYGSTDQPVPFRLEKGYLIVTKCSIADLPDLTAIVDTGATETVVDSAITQRLQLPSKPDRATFIAAEGPVQSAILPSLSFGPIRINSLSIIATDLSGLTGQFGFRPDVLIGMDVLHRSSFAIDYKSRILKFERSSSSFSHAAALVDGERFALVDAVVSGQRTRLQLDTGLLGLVMYRDESQRKMPAQSSDMPATLSGVSESFSARTRGGQQLHVGNWSAYQVPVALIDRGSHTFGGFAGLLGARTLTSHRLYLDFANMMVYWD
jgi:predicted aspartyl protease